MVAFEFKSTTIFIWNLNVKYLGLNFFFFLFLFPNYVVIKFLRPNNATCQLVQWDSQWLRRWRFARIQQQQAAATPKREAHETFGRHQAFDIHQTFLQLSPAGVGCLDRLQDGAVKSVWVHCRPRPPSSTLCNSGSEIRMGSPENDFVSMPRVRMYIRSEWLALSLYKCAYAPTRCPLRGRPISCWKANLACLLQPKLSRLWCKYSAERLWLPTFWSEPPQMSTQYIAAKGISQVLPAWGPTALCLPYATWITLAP